MEWLDARLAELVRGRVLDVGCGEGRHLSAAAFGVDLDAARATAARARSSHVCVADARRLPFADGTFDSVLAIRVVNDAAPVDDALAELRRVLRPRGRALVYTRARTEAGDRLDASNGAARLSTHFPHVDTLRDPEHERGALFICGPAG